MYSSQLFSIVNTIYVLVVIAEVIIIGYTIISKIERHEKISSLSGVKSIIIGASMLSISVISLLSIKYYPPITQTITIASLFGIEIAFGLMLYGLGILVVKLGDEIINTMSKKKGYKQKQDPTL